VFNNTTANKVQESIRDSVQQYSSQQSSGTLFNNTEANKVQESIRDSVKQYNSQQSSSVHQRQRSTIQQPTKFKESVRDSVQHTIFDSLRDNSQATARDRQYRT
jgi:hypothetical protein